MKTNLYLVNVVDYLGNKEYPRFYNNGPEPMPDYYKPDDWIYIGEVILPDIDPDILLGKAIDIVDKTEEEVKLQHSQKIQQLREQLANLMALTYEEI